MLSLRDRLLTSYLFLLAFALAGIAFALFVTTASQPAPVEPSYQRLSALATKVEVQAILSQIQSPSNRDESSEGIAPPIGQNSEVDRLTAEEEAYLKLAMDDAVRVLIFEVRDSMEDVWQGMVSFDTDRTLDGKNELIRFRLDDYQNPYREARQEQIFGTFVEEGEQWLFSGVAEMAGPTGDERIKIVAERRPRISLQDVLLDFGPALVTPLVQAAVFGLIGAVALSALISRTIASPLQAAAEAATGLAKGDLTRRVPLTGPTEVRSVGRAFNTMAEEVQATQESQRSLLANVSHDLKTPLTSIQGYSQAIVDGATKDPSRAAEIIYDEAARLTRMVTELTELARVQGGKLSMRMKPIDLGEVASSVANQLRVVAENQDIMLEARTPSMPLILGDGDRLVQVLTNLMSNAIKYTPAKGQVYVRTAAEDEGVRLIVWDTGMGIPANELSRIFERFYQVDKARGPSRGTGLGLAITKEIVQAHGGTISVESEEGQGTAFHVWFPCLNGDELTSAKE